MPPFDRFEVFVEACCRAKALYERQGSKGLGLELHNFEPRKILKCSLMSYSTYNPACANPKIKPWVSVDVY
jgi:hypothetical protein